MNITTKTLWIAIHRIFSAEGVRKGGCLSLKVLMDGWRETGLRQTDLGTGLESLIEGDCVALEIAATGPVARLLDESFGRVRPGSSDVQDIITLAQLREKRRRPQEAALFGRSPYGQRVEDQVEEFAEAA